MQGIPQELQALLTDPELVSGLRNTKRQLAELEKKCEDLQQRLDEKGGGQQEGRDAHPRKRHKGGQKAVVGPIPQKIKVCHSTVREPKSLTYFKRTQCMRKCGSSST